jgi:hypothetical protein
VRVFAGAVLAAALIVVPLASAAQFGRPAEIPVAGTPAAVAVSDATQDGIADVVVGNASTQALTLLRGRGTGAFDRSVAFGNGPAARAIAVSDFDNDGGDDLAVAGGNEIAIYLGADAVFVRHASLGLPSAKAVLATDLDLDGNVDLVAAAANKAAVTVFPGAGDGTFLQGVDYATSSAATSLFAADVNGDELSDLIIGGNGISVLLGNGDATLGPPASVTDTGGTTALTGEDFDGDGDVDLAAAHTPNVVQVLFNDGEGQFPAATLYRVGGTPVAIAASYVDGDSSLDLVTANRGTNDVSLLLGSEDGGFQQQARVGVGKGPAALAVGDLNGDGTNDLVVADRLSKAVTVLLNGADAPQPVVCQVPPVARKTLARARRLVASANCKVGAIRRKYSSRIRRGKVIAVSPPPGTRRPVDTQVTLLVSRGAKPKR